MNRVELVASIAESAGLRRIDAEKALEAFIESVSSSLALGEDVRILGFGTFSVVQRAATSGRNLRTGEVIKIPPRMSPKFKPGKLLKERVSKAER